MQKTIVQALRQGLIEEMERDQRVVLLGEDIGVFGGAYRVTEGLYERFGEGRVKDTPISEGAIIGAAVGAAMTGLVPVAEMQFNDFIACGMDQLCNQAAKMRSMMGGQVSVPMVLRAPMGATGRAAQHSQCLEGWFMHCPGLKVVLPATPYDAKGLLKTAIRDENPVVFLEHKMLYGGASPGGKAKSAVGSLSEVYRAAPDEEYTLPLGVADVKREGKDVTVIATSFMVHLALEAAAELEGEGVDLEVVDLRSLVPLDRETILSSVEKTGRAVIVMEEVTTAGAAAEIAALLAEEGIFFLKGPVKRVCSKDTPIPFAPVMEADAVPGRNDIIDAVREVMEWT